MVKFQDRKVLKHRRHDWKGRWKVQSFGHAMTIGTMRRCFDVSPHTMTGNVRIGRYVTEIVELRAPATSGGRIRRPVAMKLSP